MAWTHKAFACSQATKLVSFHWLSVLRVGTWQRKKTSYGLVASAKRKRRILPLGKYCSAKSSSIRCRVSRFCPLIGTLTKHSSDDQ